MTLGFAGALLAVAGSTGAGGRGHRPEWEDNTGPLTPPKKEPYNRSVVGKTSRRNVTHWHSALCGHLLELREKQKRTHVAAGSLGRHTQWSLLLAFSISDLRDPSPSQILGTSSRFSGGPSSAEREP